MKTETKYELRCQLAESEAACTHLREQLAEAKADSARMDWIANASRKDGRDGGWTGLYILPTIHARMLGPHAETHGYACNYETPREAIDAAMAAQAGKVVS